ncbi:MAG TPA: hypothetical protein VFJ76_08315 [Solirubrobacterales bacterium]|nr:hypothetical protein [Solirubrobacterales bacterium]
MEQTEATPVVPLEAGAGPDNPACPACGEPLFGWLGRERGLAGPVRRCESCGLGIVGEVGDAEAALHELDSLRQDDVVRIDNRGSTACALGGAGWAGLLPQRRHLFTPEAVRRLVANRDQVVKSARWRPLAGLANTWQTLLNSVTFGRNVALGALRGTPAVPAARPWQRRIDALAGIVLALPALLIAIPVELVGGIFRRGAVIALKLELF